ncbi:VWA domain-containing protein [Telmatobacter bradus]|uniref:VWA domain-containing protein n=1 Tax=Telmatobacter bradus TaxID=474953 RepID=UPI003B42E5BC
MTIERFVCLLFALVLSSPAWSIAQNSRTSHGITIAVAIDTKSSQPVVDLAQHDFIILDNKIPRPITSFRVLSSASEPVHVILLIDAVNMPFRGLSHARLGIEEYLKSNQGKLAYPTTLAILTDKGVQIAEDFSSNGNALNDVFQRQQIGLRQITRNSEWGGYDRLQISVEAFFQLVDYASGIPGRKAIIWFSPGWPLISGPNVMLSTRDEKQLFNDVVSSANRLRQSNLTLYNVNPWGVDESLDRANYFEAFLKAPVNANGIEAGYLGLQVLAIHSGGLAIESNNDVARNIETCLNKLRSWYEIAFDPLPADKPNEYHHIEVRLNQRALTAHTTDGYYANPTVLQP